MTQPPKVLGPEVLQRLEGLYYAMDGDSYSCMRMSGAPDILTLPMAKSVRKLKRVLIAYGVRHTRFVRVFDGLSFHEGLPHFVDLAIHIRITREGKLHYFHAVRQPVTIH